MSQLLCESLCGGVSVDPAANVRVTGPSRHVFAFVARFEEAG